MWIPLEIRPVLRALRRLAAIAMVIVLVVDPAVASRALMGSVRLVQPQITALLTRAIHEESKLTTALLQKTTRSITMHIRAGERKQRSVMAPIKSGR